MMIATEESSPRSRRQVQSSPTNSSAVRTGPTTPNRGGTPTPNAASTHSNRVLYPSSDEKYKKTIENGQDVNTEGSTVFADVRSTLRIVAMKQLVKSSPQSSPMNSTGNSIVDANSSMDLDLSNDIVNMTTPSKLSHKEKPDDNDERVSGTILNTNAAMSDRGSECRVESTSSSTTPTISPKDRMKPSISYIPVRKTSSGQSPNRPGSSPRGTRSSMTNPPSTAQDSFNDKMSTGLSISVPSPSSTEQSSLKQPRPSSESFDALRISDLERQINELKDQLVSTAANAASSAAKTSEGMAHLIAKNESLSNQNRDLEESLSAANKKIDELTKEVGEERSMRVAATELNRSLEQEVGKLHQLIDQMKVWKEEIEQSLQSESKERSTVTNVVSNDNIVDDSKMTNQRASLEANKKILSEMAVISNGHESLSESLRNITETLCEKLFSLELLLDDDELIMHMKKHEPKEDPYSSTRGWQNKRGSRKPHDSKVGAPQGFQYGKPSKRHQLMPHLENDDSETNIEGMLEELDEEHHGDDNLSKVDLGHSS